MTLYQGSTVLLEDKICEDLVRRTIKVHFCKNNEYDIFLTSKLNHSGENGIEIFQFFVFFSDFDITLVAYFSSLSFLTKMIKTQKFWKWAWNVTITMFLKNPVNSNFCRIPVKFLHNLVLHKRSLNYLLKSYPYGTRQDEI